jgi:hypothetical protein
VLRLLFRTAMPVGSPKGTARVPFTFAAFPRDGRDCRGVVLSAAMMHTPAWIRETSPPYGAPPAPSPAEVARELVDAWHALSRAESAVALGEGDTLRLVADQRLHLRLGFSSFHDFSVDAAEMPASTAKRRVALSRLASECPPLRDALLDGTVSPCQALALRPIVTAESASWWIAVAARSTVTELRAAVRQALTVEEVSSPESAPDQSPSPAATGSTTSSSASDSFDHEPEGKRVSIVAPIAARLAFEQGLEAARKVLGYDAPRHVCVAAMLAEVAGDGLTGESTASADRDSSALTGPQSASQATSSHDASLSGRSPDSGPVSSRDSVMKAVPGYMRASLKQARRTIEHAYEQLDSFRELLEEAPTEADAADPASLVERLEEIRALSAPIHVLSLRVLLHLEDVSAARYLGVRTQDALAETHLRLSPRTFRQLMAEAWQMKRRPELETAYLSGRVGVSRLRLLGSIESRRLKTFLARARRITLRQLKRELRFHEKLVVLRDQLQRERSAQERFAERHEDVARGARPDPNHDCKDRPPVLVLSDFDLDPLSGQDLDVKLACILLQHGHLAQELEQNLTRPALCTADETASLIAKAKTLASPSGREYGQRGLNLNDELDGSGRCARDGAGRRARSEGDARASREGGCAGGAAYDHIAGDEFEIYQRDPAANPALMRLLETLVDLALLSVCDDSVLVGSQVYPRGRQSLNLEGDFCRISFWAPDPVIEDLNHFLDNIRQRVGPLPAWAALMLLVRDATDVWKQVDRKKKPQFWRIFERDDYLCQTPACSKRADLHGHHIRFRAHGGSDDPSNLVSACYGHHQQGVHDGHLRCTGDANRILRWVLGPRAKRGGPFRVYYGDLRVI